MLSMMIWGAGRKFYRGKYYIVQKGDNLWNIAKRFYGAGAEYYRIVRKNHLQENCIFRRQKVRYKVYDEEDKKERTLEECVTPLEVGSVRRVQVKKGDTREVHHFRVLEELKE